MAKVNIALSGALARVAEKNIILEAENLDQVLKELATKYGESFSNKLFDGNGKPRRFINIYVDGRDYRFLEKLETKLVEGAEVSIIPAVSGG